MKTLLSIVVAAILVRNLIMAWAAYATPGYSLSGDFLSELAAIDAPHQLLVTIWGPALTGAVLLAAGPALWTLWRRTTTELAGAAMLTIAGVAYLGIALAPCDPGCTTANMGPRMTIHLISGLVAMGGLLFAGLAMALGRIRAPADRRLGWALLTTACFGVAAFFVLAVMGQTLQSPGLVQRTAQFAGDLSVVGIVVVSWRKLVRMQEGRELNESAS
ncbi:DUF998 domain-containing protein [Biformimicrobium ophioploci]|uniref:DUF998 domain-containing protein n=1 Tax=Biformimicrobium ophioploci TaxID=3036711 RepID=A0ABQ6LYJ0_9GAMM|nr:DUF998 domain-containing protein [Microbulbifer sp. NKW57]GMG87128.1 hypothetical protein MNKW57_14490 [Microbulbifer sp. NKW57]